MARSLIRIGICGASGAGKTTFAKKLAMSLKLPIYHEPVRPWLRRQGVNFTDLTQSQFERLQVHLCNKYAKTIRSSLRLETGGVFDRTPIDNIVYSAYPKKIRNYNLLFRKSQQLVRNFDYFIFFPAYRPFLIDDGDREIDFKSQVIMGSLIMHQIVELGLVDKTLIYDHSQTQEANISSVHSIIR